MRPYMERLNRGSWKVIGRFENSAEALRLLPSTGRILGCTVRLREFGEIIHEPLTRGVISDYDVMAGHILRFTPQ